MTGKIGILNVGAGDTKLTFDPSKPAEVKRASKVVTDMLRRGFAILVEVGRDDDNEPLYRRAKAFDPDTAEYIIVGAPEDEEEATPQAQPEAQPRGKSSRKKAAPRERRVRASTTNAVAVARTAGG